MQILKNFAQQSMFAISFLKSSARYIFWFSSSSTATLAIFFAKDGKFVEFGRKYSGEYTRLYTSRVQNKNDMNLQSDGNRNWDLKVWKNVK